MAERVCPGGHVLDPGAAVCSRCNLPPISETKEEEKVEEPKARKAKKGTKKLGKAKKSNK